MSLVDEICHSLQSKTPEQAGAELLLAGQLFARWNQRRCGGQTYTHHAEVVNAETLSESGTETLRNGIQIFIRKHIGDNTVSTAVFALGKLANPSDEALFAEVLRVSLAQSNSDALYQALIALDNLILLPGRPRSLSLLDDTANRDLASRYLRGTGTEKSR